MTDRIERELDLPASPARVWRSLTDPDLAGRVAGRRGDARACARAARPASASARGPRRAGSRRSAAAGPTERRRPRPADLLVGAGRRARLARRAGPVPRPARRHPAADRRDPAAGGPRPGRHPAPRPGRRALRPGAGGGLSMADDPAGAVFGALAEPMRRRLLQTIAQHPATATELASELPISRQAVTKHLSSLSEAGLLERERSGRDIRYRVTPAPLTEAMSWMAARRRPVGRAARAGCSAASRSPTRRSSEQPVGRCTAVSAARCRSTARPSRRSSETPAPPPSRRRSTPGARRRSPATTSFGALAGTIPMNDAMYVAAGVLAVDDDVGGAGLAGQVVALDRRAGGGAAVGRARRAACCAARPRCAEMITRWPAGSLTGLPPIGADDVRRAAGCRRWRSPSRRWPSGSASPTRPGPSAGCPSTSPSTATSAGRSRPPRRAGRRPSAIRIRTGAPSSRTGSAPSFMPISSAPMLLECLRIWATVSVSSPWASASWIWRSATCSTDGMLNWVSGLTTPSWSAPATVIALNVEPGS